MSSILPQGEDLRRAVKWISSHLQENQDQPVMPLVQEAIFKFDLSPMDADFLIGFYSRKSEDR
ncbi:hypothetical protein [Geobacter sp. SVR]|uniref:hypothetical protein n=1 Tax=Geobacter sp. SVR TaxID=2495594 RepID=UPI00143EF5C1|nr:hypothetical protein [Geobacter sp. SVR]BCS52065.1 hypothetical protein GSVR_03730 [Geobacter sp. SVR]GCF86520.1 hypothetical protein GSbR_31200 [Geobacter sp. SVR]